MSGDNTYWHQGIELTPGTVIWYDFGQKRAKRREPHKIRPVMMLCCDSDNLIGVPLSTKIHSCDSNPLVARGTRKALTCMTTVLDPDRFRKYMGDLSQFDVEHVKKAVAQRLAKPPSDMPMLSRFVAGDAYAMVVSGRPTGRLLFVIGNELEKPKANPVLMMTMEQGKTDRDFRFHFDVQPFDRTRFPPSTKVGTIGPEKLAMVRAQLCKRLGLAADMPGV